MKKILILTAILFAMVSCGCAFDSRPSKIDLINEYIQFISSEQPDTNVYHNSKRTDDVYHVPVIHITDRSNTVNLRVVVIDSCEYLVGNTSSGYAGYGYLSHKGNCKYCAERRKRELENTK